MIRYVRQFFKLINFKSFAYYFKRNKRITNGLWEGATVPLIRSALLRLVDFLVRMWRLKGFWCINSPVPVTLKRFFALEFVLTFGIINNLNVDYTLLAVSPHVKRLLGLTSNISPFLGWQRYNFPFISAKPILNATLWQLISKNLGTFVVSSATLAPKLKQC
ncbi:MAG TPA: hypothetical protein VL053_15355 [Arachidicoccus sp.]|nr:hypothetical protein [Arachidicoccus sp.]